MIKYSKKKQNETLDIKNKTEMKNALAGIVSRPDVTKGSFKKLEDISIETPKVEKQREKHSWARWHKL